MSEDSELTRTRLDVAEMKGMLGQALLSFDTRLSDHDRRLDDHERRLDEKGKLIARDDERLKDLEEDSAGRHARILGVSGLVVSVIAVAVTIYNLLTIGL